jgi:photosystem II stability/assembly factor-like uncharacterized protein
MYLATGDADGATMTRGYSIGVIKSTNGGDDWGVTNLASEIQDGILVASLYVDPDSSNVVLAGTNKGIYMTRDGGNEWEQVTSGAYFRAITPVLGSTEILLASTYSMGGNSKVYRSTDGGYTWEESWYHQEAVRMRFGTTPADANIVYMVVAKTSTYGLLGFYRSDDAGKTWEDMECEMNILGRRSDGQDWNERMQGYYDLAIAVDPNNPDIIAVGGINIWLSEDGGNSWEMHSNWYTTKKYPYVHADHHYFVFDERNGDLIAANDGGIYINANFPDPESWEDVSDGVSAGQFYKISIANSTDLMCIAGAQDNSTHILYGGEWMNVGSGDGMDCEINQNDRRIIYWSSQYGSFSATYDGLENIKNYFFSSHSTGESADWTAPLILDPTNNDNLYIGHQNVWHSSNKGENWVKYGTLPTANSAVVNVLEVAEADNSIIYASSGSTLMKRVGESNWQVIGNFNSYINSIKADKEDPHSVWVCFSGFMESQKVDYLKYDGNGGYEVIDKSTGFINVPVNDILLMDDNETVFAGTDIGVFVKEGFNVPWRIFNEGMPYLIVNDLEYNKKNQTLYAGTYGKGVWQTKIYDCDIETPIVSVEGELEVCEGDSVTMNIDNFDSFSNVFWSTGDTIPELTVKSSGSYYAIAETDEGCVENSEMFHVNVLDFNEVQARSSNGAFAFCEDEDSLRLIGSPGYESYLWSTGETSIRIYIKEPGDYWLECVSRNGCKGRHEFTIVESAYPETPEIIKSGEELVSSVEASSYQWYRNSLTIEGATKINYTPTESGRYTVEVFSEGGCSAISEEVDMTVSVNDSHRDLNYLSIYPNPNSGSVTIDMQVKGTQNGKITVIDTKGNQMIIHDNLVMAGDFTFNLDTSSLPSGYYFMRLEIGDNVWIQKVIKE